MQVPGVNCVVACKPLYQSRIKRYPFFRLGNIDETHASKAGNLLRGARDVGCAKLCGQHLRVGSFSVVPHDFEEGLHRGAFPVSRGCPI